MVLITPVQIQSIWRSYSPELWSLIRLLVPEKSFCRINWKVCWNKAAFGWIFIFRMRDKRIDSFLEESHQCDSMVFNLFCFSVSHCIKYPKFISMSVHFIRTSFSIQWLFQYSNTLRFIYTIQMKRIGNIYGFVQWSRSTNMLHTFQQRETIMLVVTFPFVVRLRLLHSCV